MCAASESRVKHLLEIDVSDSDENKLMLICIVKKILSVDVQKCFILWIYIHAAAVYGEKLTIG